MYNEQIIIVGIYLCNPIGSHCVGVSPTQLCYTFFVSTICLELAVPSPMFVHHNCACLIIGTLSMRHLVDTPVTPYFHGPATTK